MPQKSMQNGISSVIPYVWLGVPVFINSVQAETGATFNFI